MVTYIKNVLDNMPADWLDLTTHRLDIYNEEQAKLDFLQQFEKLYQQNDYDTESLAQLPTAYDYIRLGHPLSSVLEWMVGKIIGNNADQVISFSSQVMPILAVLRTNAILDINTRIVFQGSLPTAFDSVLIKEIYDYDFMLEKVTDLDHISDYDGSTILITDGFSADQKAINDVIDFHVALLDGLGSLIMVRSADTEVDYTASIQHVRRRESIAMTPSDCAQLLGLLLAQAISKNNPSIHHKNKMLVQSEIKSITGTHGKSLIGSSGLSIQYAIMMGLIHDANDQYPDRSIKFVVPPNCYGGTNDQARRVAACLDNVEIVDLPVDGDNDMVKSVNQVLDAIAAEDAVPYIIAEIPTNPRVEVPDMVALQAALSQVRKTPDGGDAIAPVFILDQTFCPNLKFLADDGWLSSVMAISYASGSKFPSGGRCTAGYCVGNALTSRLMDKIDLHLRLCDNEATALQVKILSEQLPSMLQRIDDAYANTRAFVSHIEKELPEAKINFVSEELADEGFTPSVFSLDLPTKGKTDLEKETYKRSLNHKLIKMMITEIPDESKYCVSYGQLKGCYWTIPATSTQGTTKEGDKDYIARVAVSPNLDLEKHKNVFSDFVRQIT